MMLNKMVCDSFRPEQRYSYRFRAVATLCRGAEPAVPDCSSAGRIRRLTPASSGNTDCVRAGSVRPIRRELSGPGYNKIC